jgi:hypothetical protein
MSDRGTDALDAEAAVEAKLEEAGADTIRRPSFPEPEAVEDPVEGTPGPLRNDLGQYTTAEDTEVEETTDEVVDADTPQGDPAVAAFLKKYGGDVDKALEGAVHLQRKAGEQSNEVGELRRMVDELSTLSQSMQQANQPQQQFVDQATYDQQVVENPAQALEWARQQGNQLLVRRGLSVWKEIDPYEAAVYTNRLENQATYAQMQAQIQSQAQLPRDSTVHLALQSVLNRNPQFTNYNDAIETTLANHPFAGKALEQATNSGDPAQIEGAIETLYHLAVGDTLQTLALTPTGDGDTTTTQDVVTPSVSETRDPAPPPTPQEQWREEFRQEAERKRLGVWMAE